MAIGKLTGVPTKLLLIKDCQHFCLRSKELNNQLKNCFKLIFCYTNEPKACPYNN
ncbi:hypothetical protein DB41_CX00100 [Neochlamydia sp. TUME1]|nr:hypothetical protein DB41_CX00100 [Neochlamydia sp. TUME1]